MGLSVNQMPQVNITTGGLGVTKVLGFLFNISNHLFSFFLV